MKITVISIGDPKDKRTWSGTTSHMYEALNNSNVDVDTIHVQTGVSTLDDVNQKAIPPTYSFKDLNGVIKELEI